MGDLSTNHCTTEPKGNLLTIPCTTGPKGDLSTIHCTTECNGSTTQSTKNLIEDPITIFFFTTEP